MQSKRKTLPSVLLIVLSTLGIFIGGLIIGFSLLSITILENDTSIPAIDSGNFTFYALIFMSLITSTINILTLISGVNFLRKKQSRDCTSPKKSSILILLALWIASLAAGFFASKDTAWHFALAFFTVIAILVPIWILITIARNGLSRSTRQRELGTMTIGLSASPLLIIIIEMVLISFVAILVIFSLGVQDQLVQQLSQMLEGFSSPDLGVKGMENVLFEAMQEPIIALAVFISLGVIAPLIEEIFKPMAIWFLLNRPLADAEGYGLGLISGGAFAFLESAGMIIQMDPADWLNAIILRAGTGVLHIGLSGLVGFGLVRSKTIKKPGRSILVILAAAGLHGLWNSLALYSGLSVMPAAGKPLAGGTNITTIVSIILMGSVFIGVIAINFFINRFLRRAAKRQFVVKEQNAVI